MYIIHLIFFLICEIVLSMQTSTFLLYSDLRHLSTWLYEHLSCFLIAVFNFIISIDHHLANPLHTYFFIFLFLPQLVCFMLLPQKQGKTMLWWMSFIYIGKKNTGSEIAEYFQNWGQNCPPKIHEIIPSFNGVCVGEPPKLCFTLASPNSLSF